MRISFHTDTFNSAYWSFDKCLAWAQRNGVHRIECGLIDGVSWIHGISDLDSFTHMKRSHHRCVGDGTLENYEARSPDGVRALVRQGPRLPNAAGP